VLKSRTAGPKFGTGQPKTEDVMKFSKHTITPCLWFDKKAEVAAKLYVSIFPDSKLGRIARYSNEGQEIHGKKPDSVLTVEFEINRQQFVALNGGPMFKFNEAVSLQVPCGSQEEIDYYWKKLGDGGEEGPCGWLKDRFGLSWQVYPAVMIDMLVDPDRAKVDRVTKAYMKMKKFDLAAIERAFRG
jgi:predicted 3-demethylubiquinone-9 3-methyltransferase (glyoxalase superfamily)